MSQECQVSPSTTWALKSNARHGSRHLSLLSHLPPIHLLSLLGANPRKPYCLDLQASSAHEIRGSEKEASSAFSPLLHAWDRIPGPVMNKLIHWKKDLILAQPSSPGLTLRCPAWCRISSLKRLTRCCSMPGASKADKSKALTRGRKLFSEIGLKDSRRL